MPLLPVPHWLHDLHCRFDRITRYLEADVYRTARLERKINRVLDLEGVIISDQDILDADVAKLVGSLNAIVSEIAALKDQPQAAALDFSGLDSVVAGIGQVAADNAPPVVDVPVDESPVDEPVAEPPADVPVEDTSVSS